MTILENDGPEGTFSFAPASQGPFYIEVHCSSGLFSCLFESVSLSNCTCFYIQTVSLFSISCLFVLTLRKMNSRL